MYCKHCGNKIDAEDARCRYCDTKVGEGTSYCAHCGAPVGMYAEYCTTCGFLLSNSASDTSKNNAIGNKSLYNVAKIFMLIGCILYVVVALFYGLITGLVIAFEDDIAVAIMITMVCFMLVPLAWTIPMTVHVFKSVKNDTPVSIAFKICTLIFFNTISGVLLLCSSDNK